VTAKRKAPQARKKVGSAALHYLPLPLLAAPRWIGKRRKHGKRCLQCCAALPLPLLLAAHCWFVLVSARSGARTHDHQLKRLALCQAELSGRFFEEEHARRVPRTVVQNVCSANRKRTIYHRGQFAFGVP
jgi:hypothetical protein